jgi:hypothetical protein
MVLLMPAGVCCSGHVGSVLQPGIVMLALVKPLLTCHRTTWSAVAAGLLRVMGPTM